MNLTEHSRNQLRSTFARWHVPADYADPMMNYLFYGFAPGSFFTSVLANDFMGAMAHSHPSNTIPALKNLTGWINDAMPPEAWGSYTQVKEWLDSHPETRRSILESHQLILTSKEEVWAILKNTPTHEPMIW
jgi:hypothetical protein